MAKKRRVYQPRVFDGRVIMADEIERIHKEVLKFERIEAISDPMREVDRGPMAGTGAQAAAEKSTQLSRQAATRHADSIGSGRLDSMQPRAETHKSGLGRKRLDGLCFSTVTY
jgi:hypothetical protein